jgi:3-oxoacyl-[acyl-carrier protein] reductase
VTMSMGRRSKRPMGGLEVGVGTGFGGMSWGRSTVSLRSQTAAARAPSRNGLARMSRRSACTGATLHPPVDTLPAMDLGLSGKVALVTGASQGIGFGIAKELAAEGARVAVSSRTQEKIEAAAGEIGAHAYVHDTLELDAGPDLIAAVERDLGPVDILVTNTGGPAGGDPLEFTREQWESAHRELVVAPIEMIELVVPGMRERGFGRILSVSSSAAREPIPSLLMSNSHRPGLLGAFKTLAQKLAGDGITLNTILPGRIATDRISHLHGSIEKAQEVARQEIPAGRLGTAEEIAAAAAFLCSERAGYITGVALLVDGGLTKSL